MRIESAAVHRWSYTGLAAGLSAGVVAAGIAVLPDNSLKLMLAGFAGLALAFFAVCQKPYRWLYLFFTVDLLSPPLPGAPGNPAIHLAPAAFVLGLFAGVVRWPEWRFRTPAVLFAFGAFLLSLIASVPFAVVYSGADIAWGSTARITLLLISVYAFAYAVCAPQPRAFRPARLARFLFGLAVLSAAFACLDFYFHFPAPAGFSDQFVWLTDGVFRRAQGLFYDASTLGNFCSFFIIYAVIALDEGPERGHPARVLLVAGALTLATALMLSYSRASLLNLVIAVTAYAVLRGARIRNITGGILLASAVAVTVIDFVYPSFAANYWSHINGTIRYLSERPDGVLSGRLTNWQTIFDFIAQHPWETIVGIGYKTLPYTSHLGDPVIADNTWLSLFVETGVGGVVTFLVLLVLILRTSFRAAKSTRPDAAFLGKWVFCFWCGQTAQMMSGDLLTYWRVLPVYFWVFGAAIRESEVVE